MEVFILSYEGLDSSENGVLSIYSNMTAAEQAKLYAESLNHYYRLYIEKTFVSDKFSTLDFD